MNRVCVVGFVYFEVYVPHRWHDVPPGEEHYHPSIPVRAGGALNTASILRALDVDVCLAHPAGLGMTDIAVAELIARLRIPTIRWASPDDPAITVVIHHEDDRSFLSSAAFDAIADCPGLGSPEWLHVAGLHEAHVLSDEVLRARDRGAKVSVSASWDEDELERLAQLEHQPWDLLLMNAKEAQRAVGSAQDAPSKLQGAARDIVVTAGSDGAFGVVDGKKVAVPAAPATVIERTGAGDAFCGGVIAALVQGRSPTEALELGTQTAAIQLGVIGGVAELERFEHLRRKKS